MCKIRRLWEETSTGIGYILDGSSLILPLSLQSSSVIIYINIYMHTYMHIYTLSIYHYERLSSQSGNKWTSFSRCPSNRVVISPNFLPPIIFAKAVIKWSTPHLGTKLSECPKRGEGQVYLTPRHGGRPVQEGPPSPKVKQQSCKAPPVKQLIKLNIYLHRDWFT